MANSIMFKMYISEKKRNKYSIFNYDFQISEAHKLDILYTEL